WFPPPRRCAAAIWPPTTVSSTRRLPATRRARTRPPPTRSTIAAAPTWWRPCSPPPPSATWPRGERACVGRRLTLPWGLAARLWRWRFSPGPSATRIRPWRSCSDARVTRSSACSGRASRRPSSSRSGAPPWPRSCAWRPVEKESNPRIREARTPSELATEVVRPRLEPSVFRLPVERIREGYYSDAYFNYTKQLLEERGRRPRVTMQVFQKHDSVLGG